jgi:HTH-type transcriptional regulator, sugar sensing transcriptional regulator
MIKSLISLGLTDKEASVYLALLSGGEMTADQLSRSSKLNRSTTYVQIKFLIESGLISTFKRGKKTIFAAESPNNLVRILEHKQQQIELQKVEVTKLVPELLKLFGGSVDRPTVRVFEGKEGLVSMRSAILDQKPDRLLMVTAYNQMQKIFTTEELKQFTDRREKLGIESWVMYTLPSGDDFVPFRLQKLKRIKAEELPFGSDMYNNTVSFASAKEGIVGLTITNQDIANTMRAMYLGLWNQKPSN